MQKKRILFVDDEPNILSGIKRLMRPLRQALDCGYAESGAKALQAMEEEPYDIVVTDMRMPGMDGAELLTKIRDKYPETIRIILSGQAQNKAILSTVTIAHQFLSKPCEPESMKNTLHRACLLHNLLSHTVMRQVVAKIDRLPSLPSIYKEMQDILADPECSVDDVAQCISRDISMSAKILQLVNTAFFGFFKKVESPAQAAHLLGLETINSLVLSVGIFAQYEGDEIAIISLPDLWKHSMTVGAYAKKIAESQTEDKDIINNAFIAGLQHDIGRLILVSNMPDQYREILAEADRQGIAIHEMEYSIFKTGHAEVGSYLLGLWGFSASVLEAIAYHHRPGRYPEQSFDAVCAVHVANVLEYEQHHDKSENMPQLDTRFLEKIGCLDRVDEWRKLCREEKKNSNE